MIESLPLDAVIHFDVMTHNPSTGAISDADSTPTFDVYENAVDTGMLGATNFTKRTSLTGDYRGTTTLSAANGFEVGKCYNVIASATVAAVTAKKNCGMFRIVPAETATGVPKVDMSHTGGTSQTAGDIIGDTNDIQARLPAALVSGRLDASVGAMAASVLTAAAIASAAFTSAKFAADAIDANALATTAAQEIADALLDRTAGVETGYTPRQAMRLILAACAAKISGAATTTVSIRDVNDTKDRIVAAVDGSGNRSSVTTDVT